MAHFSFLDELEPTPLVDFWRMDEHPVPASPGVYFLVAKPSVRFTYPKGKSPIFYIGQAASLRRRLTQHFTFSTHVRENRRVGYSLYFPRYEYAGAHGGRYCYLRTWQGCTPRALEEIVLARFAEHYRSFPVCNGAGSWNRVSPFGSKNA
jgi:hypothetical protein